MKKMFLNSTGSKFIFNNFSFTGIPVIVEWLTDEITRSVYTTNGTKIAGCIHKSFLM